MSKLEELINRLCPNGVEYKPLWSVTAWDKKFNAVDRSMQSKTYSYHVLLAKDLFAMKQEEGNVFLLSTGVETGWTTEEIAGESLCEGEVVTLPWGKSSPVKGLIKYYKGKFVTGDNRIATSLDTNILDNKYLYYWMVNNGDVIDTFYRGSGIKHPSMYDVLMMKLPVPPLEVQREIVRVLDNFTFLTTELAAELAARQKQYEYYRNLLLTFKPDESTILNERTNELELNASVRWMKLGESCKLKAGKSISAREISSVKNDDDPYPCFGGNGIRGYVKLYNQEGEHPLIGRQGALCGNICYATDKFYATEHAIVVTSNEVYNERFLYYLLQVAKLEQYKTAGAQPGLSVAKLETVILPVPPLSEQRRIVSILDRFDALCNDITSGLPAEIAMRQKQYEYYRDKFLTFKELKKEA